MNQVAFVDDQQVVQTFLPHATHPPLSISIGIWSSIGRQNHFDALRGKHRIKAGRKLRVTIVKQKAHSFSFLLELPHQLTGLLHHPGCCRMHCAASQMNLTDAYLNEEENIECVQSQRFHGEEITRQQLLLVLAQES